MPESNKKKLQKNHLQHSSLNISRTIKWQHSNNWKERKFSINQRLFPPLLLRLRLVAVYYETDDVILASSREYITTLTRKGVGGKGTYTRLYSIHSYFHMSLTAGILLENHLNLLYCLRWKSATVIQAFFFTIEYVVTCLSMWLKIVLSC